VQGLAQVRDTAVSGLWSLLFVASVLLPFQGLCIGTNVAVLASSQRKAQKFWIAPTLTTLFFSAFILNLSFPQDISRRLTRHTMTGQTAGLTISIVLGCFTR
jgi:hypothetical protein